MAVGESTVLIPAAILATIELADVSWHMVLLEGLRRVAAADPDYLPALAAQDYLPTASRLLAAFAQPRDAVRYVLVGEGPYPRAASATGVCFMDGAVGALWSQNGLSKPVNRATSLRNFIKMLLVADGTLDADHTTGDVLAQVGSAALETQSSRIQTLLQLQHNLTRHGFLLLNASLVFRTDVAPAKDARAWLPFLTTILTALAANEACLPTLVLWGKIAAQINAQVETFSALARLPRVVAEHPYNLTFIRNQHMHDFFRPMKLLENDAVLARRP